MLNTNKMLRNPNLPDYLMSSSTLSNKYHNSNYLKNDDTLEKINSGNKYISVSYKNNYGDNYTKKFKLYKPPNNPINKWTEDMFPEIYLRGLNSIDNLLKADASIAAGNGYRINEIRLQ